MLPGWGEIREGGCRPARHGCAPPHHLIYLFIYLAFHINLGLTPSLPPGVQVAERTLEVSRARFGSTWGWQRGWDEPSSPCPSLCMSHLVPCYTPQSPSISAALQRLIINNSPSSLQKQMKAEGNPVPLLSPPSHLCPNQSQGLLPT